MNSHPAIPSANFVPLKSPPRPVISLAHWRIKKKGREKKILKREKYVWIKEHGKVKVKMECFEGRLI